MVSALAPWALLLVVLLGFLLIDLRLFARGREPAMREGAVWSVGWLVMSLGAAVPLLLFRDSDTAVLYTTVYLIERTLSLDNLFVFLILFSYFGIRVEHRARLLFWGIVAALTLRGLAILGGVSLIERFHAVIYVLGIALIYLAYRLFRGVSENVDPDRNPMVRLVRRFFPVTSGFRDGHWFFRENARLHVTPLFLCLTAIVFADIAFAIDSIPAAFAITQDPFVIWMGNVFALLGLRALFVLVDGLVRRFRYLDETVAVVLAAVGVKLLTEDFFPVGPLASLAVIAALFAGGIAASLLADRRDPDGARERRAGAGEPEPGERPAEPAAAAAVES